MEAANPAVTLGPTMSHPDSPKWTVVWRGQQKRTEAPSAKQGVRARKLPTVLRKTGKSIVGTGSSGILKWGQRN